MKHRRILVPIDFSKCSDRALAAALYLGRQYDAELVITHFVDSFQFHDVDIYKEGHLSHYHQLIEDKVALLVNTLPGTTGTSAPRCQINLNWGHAAAESILQQAEMTDFDLIVMGTHGRTGLSHLFLGSVAEKIVRKSPIPVLTVHQNWKRFSLKHLLVPVDFSHRSYQAIETAVTLSGLTGARLTFLHVVANEIHPEVHGVGMPSLFMVLPEVRPTTEQHLRAFVNCDSPGNQYRIGEGQPAAAIVDFAAENDFDLIVMSTRGLTGLDHLLLGSTAEKTVRTAPCPVLTVGRKSPDTNESTVIADRMSV